MTKRAELRQAYGRGWDTWDPSVLIASLAEDFVFDDPAMSEPVTKAQMAEYMEAWQDRVKSLGGTGEIGSRDRVTLDQDGALVSWHWWTFVGTKYQGSAVTRTSDKGVEYERIAYYPDTPKFETGG